VPQAADQQMSLYGRVANAHVSLLTSSLRSYVGVILVTTAAGRWIPGLSALSEVGSCLKLQSRVSRFIKMGSSRRAHAGVIAGSLALEACCRLSVDHDKVASKSSMIEDRRRGFVRPLQG